MDRIVGLLPRGEMASGVAAIGGRNLQIVIVVDVALRASHIGVAIGQQESCGAVVESGSRPANGIVTIGTIGRGEGRASLRVRRIVGLLPGGQVAARVAAVGRRDLQIIVIVDVARRAGQVRVAVGQQETSGTVIELGAQPAIKRVAPLTISRSEGRTRRRMWRIGGLLPIL